MQKLLYLALLVMLLGMTISASAQERFSIGPRAGINLASLKADGSEFDTNTRFVGGITSTYSINEKTGIGLDLLYSGEGVERGEGLENLALSYVRLPLMFQYFFRDRADDFRPKIYLGVVPGLLVNAEVGEQDVKSSYNTFDFGGTAGLGFHYRLSPSGVWLNTDARYYRGFTGITEAERNPELNNKHWQFSVGVAFGI